MKIPKVVRIGYQDVKIERETATFSKQSDCYGEYEHRKNQITIQNDLSNLDEANTLLHEVLHACVYGSGLNQAEGPLKEDNAEELTVNQLTNYLMGVFRDNPWFLDYIKKGVNDSE